MPLLNAINPAGKRSDVSFRTKNITTYSGENTRMRLLGLLDSLGDFSAHRRACFFSVFANVRYKKRGV